MLSTISTLYPVNCTYLWYYLLLLIIFHQQATSMIVLKYMQNLRFGINLLTERITFWRVGKLFM